MTQIREHGHRAVREESGNWRGSYNIKIVDPVPGKSKHKQQSVLPGPVERPRSESELKAYDALRAEIQRVTGGGHSARPDPSITLQKFTEMRWLPLREAKLCPSSKASTMHTLSHDLCKIWLSATRPLRQS